MKTLYMALVLHSVRQVRSERKMSRGSIPDMRHGVLTGSGAHADYHNNGYDDCCPGGKTAGVLSCYF
jgi:hypothetical protein